MTYKKSIPIPSGRPDPRNAKGNGAFLRPGYCNDGYDFNPEDGMKSTERAVFLSGRTYATKPFAAAMYGVKDPVVW